MRPASTMIIHPFAPGQFTIGQESMTFGVLRRIITLGVIAAACTSNRPPAVAVTPTTPSHASAKVDSTLQIFLLAGQSNMAGRGVVEARDSAVHPRVLKLDQTMKWVPAVDPLHWDKPKIVGAGLGRSFGLVVASRNADARIGLVPAAVGGSPISTWEPGALDPVTGAHP